MREDVAFQTSDNVTLRGWFYKPSDASSSLPCLVMAHGFGAVKAIDLDVFAEYFASNLKLSCLVYDHRGFGDSDTKDGQPRQESIPSQQYSDYSDAITYAQSRPDVDAEKIGIWGTSYSGGHVLVVAAVDRRVKVVLSQLSVVDGWANLKRLVGPEQLEGMNQLFQADRLGRAAGNAPMMFPIIDADEQKPAVMPGRESFDFFTLWEKKSNWKNEVTVKSLQAILEHNPAAYIARISPTPLLMTIAEKDIIAPTEIALEAFSHALEPKKLHMLPGGHFENYSGPNFETNVKAQAAFLREHLCP